MAINDLLYRRLQKKFGDVRIANEGEQMVKNYSRDMVRSDLTRMNIKEWGESYCCCCCYCSDTRFRLQISHMWGVHDDRTNSNNLHLIKCFNTDGKPTHCFSDYHRKEELERQLYLYVSPGDRKIKLPDKQSAIGPSLISVEWPGTVLPLVSLYEQHPARSYLRERSFDPDLLYLYHNLYYCAQARDDYAPAYNRIVVPIRMHGMMVGWQCRYIGDLNWKECGIAKYWGMPGMPKRKMLYNFDNAKSSPILVIVEGPSDVWRVGHEWSVALMGKTISAEQLHLITSTWAGKPVVVMLDPNAGQEADNAVDKLKPYFNNKLIKVVLPDNTDPGSLPQADMWSEINTQANRVGINVSQLFASK